MCGALQPAAGRKGRGKSRGPWVEGGSGAQNWALMILSCLRSLSTRADCLTRAYTNQPPCEPGVLLRKWGLL